MRYALLAIAWVSPKVPSPPIEKGCGGETYAARFHFCLGVSPASLGDTRRHRRYQPPHGCLPLEPDFEPTCFAEVAATELPSNG